MVSIGCNAGGILKCVVNNNSNCSTMRIGTAILKFFILGLTLLVCLGNVPSSSAQTVTVEPVEPYIESDEEPQFRVVSSERATSEIEIQYQILLEGPEVSTQTNSSVTIRSGTSSRVFTPPYPSGVITEYKVLLESVTPTSVVLSTAAAIVNEPNLDNPGVTVSAPSDAILAGTTFKFSVSLTSTPRHQANHRIKVSWSPVGLVTKIGNVNTSTLSEKDINFRIYSQQTRILTSESGVLEVFTDATALNGGTGSITATMYEDDLIDDATEESSGKIYDPIYHSLKSSKTVAVSEQSIDWAWRNSEFNRTIVINDSYTAENVDITINKLSDTTVEIGTTELDDDDLVRSQESATVWNSTLTLGDWTANYDSMTEVRSLSFLPSSANSFNQMMPGETRTANATIQIKSGTAVIDTVTITVTLRHPKLTLTFDGSGNNTASITSDNSGSYDDLEGVGATTNIVRFTLQDFTFSATEVTSELPDLSSESLDIADLSPRPVIFAEYSVGENFRFGTWFFDQQARLFLFRPKARAIDALAMGTVVTSTATAVITGSSASQTATVTITGNGPSSTTPRLSISAVGNTADDGSSNVIVTEGDSIWFRIASDKALLEDLEIGLGVTDTGNFLVSAAPESTVMNAGESEIYLELPTKIITPDPTDVRVTMELNAGAGYLVDENNNTANVDVQDIGPALSFDVTSVTITEGEQISFTIMADAMSTDAIEIPIYYLDGVRSTFPTDESGVGSGDVLSSYLPSMVILDSGAMSKSVEIPTIDDNSDESNGQVMIGIGRTMNSRFELSTVSLSNRYLTVSATVNDNDGPVTVSVVADTPSVIEGDTAIFRIVAPYAVSIDQEIPITVTNAGGHLDGTPPPAVTIKAGETEGILKLPTKTISTDPSVDITVTPTHGTAATIRIVDAGPIVSLSQLDGSSTNEGASTELLISASPAPRQEDIIIPLAFEGTEFKIDADDLPESAIIKAGEMGTIVQLQTIDNDIRDTSTQFKVHVHRTAGSRFEISSSSFESHPNLGRVVSRTYTFVDNDADPEFSIAALSDTVLEGDVARFKISSNRGNESKLSLNLIVTRNGDFVKDSAGLAFDLEDFTVDNEAATTVDIAATETEVIYEVPTKFNNSVNTGTIKVQIQDSVGYEVDTVNNNNEDTVTVNDAGPTVSIQMVNSTNAVEGEMFELRLSTPTNFNASWETTIPIAYENFDLIGENPLREVRLTSEFRARNVTIPVKNDDIFNPGERGLTILFQRPPGGNFEWNENLTVRPSGAAVFTTVLTDNQDPPELSITAVAMSVPEGELVAFNLLRSNVIPSANELDVEIELQDVGGFIGGSRTATVKFSEGMTSVPLELPTTGNGESEGSGTVVARILDHAVYEIAEYPNNVAKVTVGGAVSVVSITGPQTVDEGDSIEFTLTASPAPSGNIVVPVSISDGMRSTFAEMEIMGLGDLLGTVVPPSVTITTSGTGTLLIPTIRNNLNDLDVRGVAHIEFHPPIGSGLDFGFNRSYRIGVLDDDPTPEISISPPSGDVLEGDTVAYSLTATSGSAEDVRVNINVTGSVSFIVGFKPTLVIIPAGQTSASLELPTKTDGMTGTDADIVVTLTEGIGYTVNSNASSANADVVNAGPVISLTNDSGSSVVEGSLVEFTVQRPTETGPELNVEYSVSDGVTTTFPDMRVRGVGNLIAANPSGTVTIPADSASANFSIQLLDDGLYGSSGELQVVLHRSTMAQYELASQDPVKITITDNQTEPVVTIMAEDSVTEGDLIQFMVTTSVGSIRELTINFSISASESSLLAEATPTSVILPAGETGTMFEVQSLTDGAPGTMGNITATLASGNGYMVPTTDDHYATVNLTNASTIITVTVDPTSEQGTKVTEGNSVTYTLTIPEMALNDIIVPISYSDGVTSTFSDERILGVGDVLGDALEPQVRISMGSIMGTVTVPTGQDEYDEDTGVIYVNFHRPSGSTFEFAQRLTDSMLTSEEANDHRQKFSVDDDTNDTPPVLSVESVYDEIFEGTFAQFRFTSVGQSSEDFPVNIMLTQTSSFLTERNAEGVTFKGRSSETIVDLMTDPGELDDFEGSITLTILEGANKEEDGTVFYTVADMPADAKTAMVRVSDNDVSMVSIAAVSETINEGEVAEFTVTRSIRSNFVLFVNVSVDQGNHDFIQGTPETIVIIPPASTTMTYSIATNDDTSDENTGSIAIEVVEGIGYTPSASADNSVTVLDNDLPEISVAAASDSVMEGRLARFTFSSVSTLESNIRIRFETSQNGDYIFWQIPNNVEIAVDGNSNYIEIQTVDDMQMEDDGSISITLQDSLDGAYQLSSIATSRTASITITDNDESNGGGPSGTSYSVASVVLNAILGNSSDQTSSESPAPPIFDLPLVSVTESVPVIEEGEVAVFSILASKAAKVTLRIEYSIELEGDFVDRSDAKPVVLAAGNQVTNIEIPTIDDDRAEPDGIIRVNLSEGDGYLVARAPEKSAVVRVSDAADRKRRGDKISGATAMILPELTWSMGENLFDAVGSRQIPVGRELESSMGLMGQSSLRDLLVASGEAVNGEGLNWRSALVDSSFAIGLYQDGGSVATGTVWGLGDTQKLHGSNFVFARSWIGEHSVGHFGFDTRMGETGLVGLATSFSTTSIDYTDADDISLEFATISRGIQPYLGWEATDGGANLMVTAGFGQGSVQVDELEYATEKAETKFNMAGVRASRFLPMWNNENAKDNSGLKLNGEAWFAQQEVMNNNSYIRSLRSEAGRYRFSVETNRILRIANGATLDPSLSLELNGSRRQSQSFIGQEIGTELDYDNPIGLEMSVSGKMQVTTMDRILNRQVELEFDYDRNHDELGLVMNLQQVWSTGMEPPQNNINESLSPQTLNMVSANNRIQFETEVGYGFTIADRNWKSTPFAGMKLKSNSPGEFRLGYRLENEVDLSMEFSGASNQESRGVRFHKVEFVGRHNW